MARESHLLGQSTLLGELMDETHMTVASRGFGWIRLPFCGDRRHPWHGSEGTREKAMEVFARSWHANRKKLTLPHPAQDQPHDGRAVKEGLFYVRWHTCADGSFEWYVLNGHTRRPASKLFRTRAAAAAERARLQVNLELAKEQVLKRTP
jgi:hypothetical protein